MPFGVSSPPRGPPLGGLVCQWLGLRLTELMMLPTMLLFASVLSSAVKS